jgi:hypothetical protein
MECSTAWAAAVASDGTAKILPLQVYRGRIEKPIDLHSLNGLIISLLRDSLRRFHQPGLQRAAK